MLVPLGILATTGGDVVLGTYEHIQTVNLAATATSITFSSILQDYKHLQIRYSSKSSTTRNTLWVNINGVTTASYANQQLKALNTTLSSTNNINTTKIIVERGIAGDTTDNFNAGIIDILDYVSTTKNKSIKCFAGNTGTSRAISLTSGLFIGTSVITSLTFAPDLDSFAIGTRFSLYGIRG